MQQYPNNEQPSYPYQQPQQPTYAPPPLPHRRPWYRRPISLIAIAIVFVVLLIIGATSNSDGSQASATPTSTLAQATQAPTATPKPTATLTVDQRVQQLVSSNASEAKSVKTSYASNDVEVNIVLDEAFDNGSYRTIIQENCFNIQKALWTGHISGLDDVNIAFSGPATDKYGNPMTAAFGECELGAKTAAQFNWPGLDQQSAWQAYDLARFYAIIQG